MKVLLLTNTKIGRRLASLTLGEHEIKVVRTFSRFREVLNFGIKFDALMTDLCVPHMLEISEKNSPIGTSAALLAISYGIKKIAVVNNCSDCPENDAAVIAFSALHDIKPRGNVIIYCPPQIFPVWIDIATKKLVRHNFVSSPEGKEKYPVNKYTHILMDYGHQGLEFIGFDWGEVLKGLEDLSLETVTITSKKTI